MGGGGYKTRGIQQGDRLKIFLYEENYKTETVHRRKQQGKDTIENKERKMSIRIRSGEQINEITDEDRQKKDIKTVYRFKKLYENLLYKEVIKK